MSEEHHHLPGHLPGRDADEELHAGALPSTNQPLGAEPRPRYWPLALVVAILAAALVIFFLLALV